METLIEKPNRYYQWLAELYDGTTFTQGQETFKEVLEKNKVGLVKYFSLIPKDPKYRQIVVRLGGNRRLIYFERTVGCFGADFHPILVYLLGWQETVRGVNLKSICYIYPNGNIEFNNDEPTLLDNYLLALRQSNATK